MVLYWIFFIVLLSLALFEVLKKNKNISFFTSSLLALLAGFRFYTGYDFTSYETFFEGAASFENIVNGNIDAESGYLLLNNLFSNLGLNFYTFVLFFSVLSIGLLQFFLYRHVPYPSLVLVYYFARYFLVRDMGQIRSALACIILLYAIPYIIKQKPVQFIVVVFIASFFHITAWFFVLAYVFNFMWKKITLSTIFTLLTSSMIIGIIVQVPQLYIWAVPDRYIAYFTNPAYTNGEWIMNPILWMQVFIFLGSFICYKPTNIEEKAQFETVLKIYFLASLMLIAAGNLGTVGGRISTLFATTEILIVPYFLMNFTRNKVLNLLFYLGFTMVIFCLIFIISGTYNDYVPYMTIFGF